ncbi:MAG: phosphodiester glycosidase family protein [Thermoanaerobaculia bacterium]
MPDVNCAHGTPFEARVAMLNRKVIFAAVLSILISAAAWADWTHVGPGVDYQEFRGDNYDVHVTRVDLTNDEIQIISTRQSEKGLKVSDFARREHALAAINGDYFDERFNPVGMTVGPCGEWDSVRKLRREGYVAIGGNKAQIAKQSDVSLDAEPEDWMEATVSGWPALIVSCKPVTPLPGSASFTLATHPRTAVGLSKDKKTLYLVVADGRRTGVPGFTLPQLAAFLSERLHACAAINLDGGGSSAMWVSDRIVNRPADGVERPVGDHLAVVLRSDYADCDKNAERVAAAKNSPSTSSGTTVVNSATTTTTTTTTTSTAPPPRKR